MQIEQLTGRVAQLEGEVKACRATMKDAEEKASASKDGEIAATAKLKGALKDLAAEAKHGRLFLDSPAGQAFEAGIRREAIEAYRDSDDFDAELKAGSEEAVLSAITATVRECRRALRARPDFQGDDFAWLCPQVPDQGSDGE